MDRRAQRRICHDRPSWRLLPPGLGRLRHGGGRRGRTRSDRQLVHLGQARRQLGVAHRHADGGHADRGDDGLVSRPRLFDRLHGGRPVAAALLRLPFVVHLRHADAGHGGQPGSDVLRLGRRRPRVVSPDRLLVRAARRLRRGDQGLRRQPGRRLRLLARHLSHLLPHRFGGVRPDLRRRAGLGGQDDSFPRLRLGRGDARLPAPVHGRDGQVGAVPAAHLASRRDGGPDAGLGPDSRGDHGHGRGVHGRAALAAVRDVAGGAQRRHHCRRHHGLLRRDHRPGAERHQAG